MDVYKKFEKDNPPRTPDDNTRNWFDKIGRNRYYKFYKTYKETDGIYDLIQDWFLKSSVVHHIYPLMYGGSSSLLNLLPTTDSFHDILHKNPLESTEKYCFQAVDYLSYISNIEYFPLLYNKYKLESYKNNTKFANKIMLLAIEEEMNIFYKQLN